MYRIRRYKTVCAVAFAFVVGLFFANEYPFRGALFQQKILLGNPDHKGHERKWWKEAVVYEIYPASFKDSNDDGIGDIPGIISKLDYLQDLGVDVIAICPHYQSPQVDMGYDVSDYNEIHRTFGTLEDVQKLINATHARGMRIIFDLVINHSSNLHKFFRESRSSKNNPKRDWYYWRPAKYDKAGNRHPPSNWRSHFTGPAWTWDEATQEYYLHVYAPEMPDFNWETIIFWLDRGLDGFRIDTVNKYSKNISFPDAEIVDPDAETQPASKFYNNGPRIHEFIGEMREIFDRYDAMSVGELSHFPRIESEVMKFVSAKANQLNMVFNFELVSFGEERKNRKGLAPFFVTTFARELSKWQYFVGGTDGWTTLFLENHDHTRSISRFGSDSIDSIPEYRVRSGKMLAVLLATMTGTLFLYQGQEIGMTNAPSSWPMSEYKDVRSINRWHKAQQQCGSDAECLTLASQAIRSDARDHARLPMQWGSGENAGFTSGTSRVFLNSGGRS
ncbi:glycoside hydrolase superfamily [Xylogone sp. PMI_703]|nr:glycoside hydrolase superfamily [Xylogone sp. PMI_703]